MQNKFKNIATKYLIYGILLGILLRVVSLYFSITLSNLPFSIDSVIQLHINEGVNYFWDFSIIVTFAVLAYLGGSSISKIRQKSEENSQKNIDRIDNVYTFVEKLRQGETDLTHEFYKKDDDLEKALINLRDELERNTRENDSRKTEDEQRHRISEGLAKFGAILRETSDNLEELANKIISELVRYIDAKQAGFFVVNDDEEEKYTIELIATFAYGRKKFSDSKISKGEGLVGACILEKETIFLEKVPEEYLKITSGLGKANPRCILIVPLKTEEGVIHGALEIASFKIYEEYEIDFVEKVAESIATTISALKINMQTAKLLKESRETERVLKEQDTKMTKTLDEMRELQKEAAKQSEEFVSFTNSVNHTMIRAEYNKKGILTYANTKFLEILGYESNYEVENRHITDFINTKDRIWFDDIWTRLVTGGKHFEGDMKHVNKEGKDVWTIATYVSVRDHMGNPEKILFLGIDTTEAKKQSLDFESQINALNHSSIKGEFYPSGQIIEFNKKYTEALKYTEEDIIGKTVFEFIPDNDIETFIKTWDGVKSGIPYEGRIRNISRDFSEVFLHGAYSIVRDMYDEISKIIFIGNDITEQHLIEQKNIEQTLQLKSQEEKLQDAKVHLSKKLNQSREEMKNQFREIETVKLLHEKTLEGMLDAIVTINQDNKIEFFNKAAEELWGMEKNDILNRDVFDLLPKEHIEMGDEYLGQYFRADLQNVLVNTRKEVFIVNKEGEPVYVLMTLSEAGLGLRYRLTAFIQRIEVELF